MATGGPPRRRGPGRGRPAERRGDRPLRALPPGVDRPAAGGRGARARRAAAAGAAGGRPLSRLQALGRASGLRRPDLYGAGPPGAASPRGAARPGGTLHPRPGRRVSGHRSPAGGDFLAPLRRPAGGRGRGRLAGVPPASRRALPGRRPQAGDLPLPGGRYRGLRARPRRLRGAGAGRRVVHHHQLPLLSGHHGVRERPLRRSAGGGKRPAGLSGPGCLPGRPRRRPLRRRP